MQWRALTSMICFHLALFYLYYIVVNWQGKLCRLLLILTMKGPELKINIKWFKLDFFSNCWLPVMSCICFLYLISLFLYIRSKISRTILAVRIGSVLYISFTSYHVKTELLFTEHCSLRNTSSRSPVTLQTLDDWFYYRSG